MTYKLTFAAEPSIVERVKPLVLQWKGSYSINQPPCCPIENYIAQEVTFDNIVEMNKFIYAALMTFGYYFLVDQSVYS